MLVPKFGAIGNPANRRKIVTTWLQSKGYRRSGLDAEELRQTLIDKVRNPGDFMRIVMDRIAAQQSVSRWALYDADNVLFIRQIKADIPDALFVHIIRDGRDIALSLKKMGGFTPFFWNRKPASLRETAIYWEWMVRRGQDQGREFPEDYIELRYEDLVSNPRPTLARLGRFLEHDLDYQRIQSTALGRVSESNSSFLGDKTRKDPVNRWKDLLSRKQIADIEELIGPYLLEQGYRLSTQPNRASANGRVRRFASKQFLDCKFWGKVHTPLGRLISVSPLELEAGAEERLA